MNNAENELWREFNQRLLIVEARTYNILVWQRGTAAGVAIAILTGIIIEVLKK